MRQTTLSILGCTLLLIAGCGDNKTTKNGADMSIAVDMTLGPDLAVRVPDGVVCGTMTCAVGQDCCVATANNMVTGESCISSAASCTGGTTLDCDGPEDCGSGSASPYCCGTINLKAAANPDAGLPTFAGGAASCTATCAFAVDALPPTKVTTRLCHQDSDCAGLAVPVVGGNTQCCSSATAPGLHFCATAVPGTVTCP